MKGKLLVVLVLVVLIGAALFVSQPFLITRTVTLADSRDAQVVSRNPTTNYGSSTVAALNFTGEGLNEFVNETYFGFDLSTLPDAATIGGISSATLNLPLRRCVRYSTGALPAPLTVVLRRVTQPAGDWTESAITWNTQPADNAVDQATFVFTTCNFGSVIALDATEAVDAWVKSAAVNFGLNLEWADGQSIVDETQAVMMLEFHSRESGTRPTLTVEYTELGTGEETGVGTGTNQTQNDTRDAGGIPPEKFALAALIFVIVFILIAILARRRPVLAVVLGTVAGAIAAGGYLLLGGV